MQRAGRRGILGGERSPREGSDLWPPLPPGEGTARDYVGAGGYVRGRPVRILAALLFTVGIPWALIAWIAVFGGPAAALEDLAHVERRPAALIQAPCLLLMSAQAALGYYVWSKWLVIASAEDA